MVELKLMPYYKYVLFVRVCYFLHVVLHELYIVGLENNLKLMVVMYVEYMILTVQYIINLIPDKILQISF